MATQLFLHTSLAAIHRGTNSTNLAGSAVGWNPSVLSTSRGSAGTSLSSSTVNGPTNGIELAGTPPEEFISEPLDSDVTISNTITVNIWAHESSMSANVAINCIIERLDSQGNVISTIAQTSRVTELGTASALANFTVSPTSTNMLKGDRIRVRVYGDDAGTMASGFTFSYSISGSTPDSSGDTFVTFTETFGFLTTTPAGTQLFLTDVAGPAVGSAVEKEMWTSRGDGVNSIVCNTAAGWTAPLQWTDSGGGTVVEWYSRPLAAFTLADLARCNIRALESNAAANASIRAELAVCDSDGTNVTVWGAASRNIELTTSEAAYTIDIAGDDYSVTTGRRLRLRVFIDDLSDVSLVTGHTATLYYDGTTGGASGDSWIQLSQTISASASASMPLLRRNPMPQLLM